jgi:hypothetical protein
MVKLSQNDIPMILDAALKANQAGLKFFPLLTGEAGIGKSEIAQAWAKAQGDDFQFIDVRIAYLEAPDMVGMIYVVNGVTHYAVPEFWPTNGRGVICFEEVNRGAQGTQNALMQILTDMKVGKLKIPDAFFCMGIINPDNGYDVNMMDAALKNRFVEYQLNFDKKAFCQYARRSGWAERLVVFLETYWDFVPASQLKEGGTYVSPRSLSKLNILESIGVKEGSLFEATVYSVLGTELGNIYISYCNKDQPVLANDFIEDEEKALARLKELSFAESGYRGDLISASTESIASGFETGILDLNLLIKLEAVLRRDVFVTMVASLPSRKIDKLNEFVTKNKDWLLAVKKKRDQTEYKTDIKKVV